MKIIQSKWGDRWLALAAFVGRSKQRYNGSTISRSRVVLRMHLNDEATALSHELVHVDQIKKMGWLKMRLTFLWQDIRYGHQKAPLEMDAFARQKDFLMDAHYILLNNQIDKK